MGNQHSLNICFDDQNFVYEQSLNDANFGSIKLYKNMYYPFNYMMMIQKNIYKDQPTHQINAYINLLEKMKQKQIQSVAKVLEYVIKENQNHILNRVDEIGTIHIFQQYYSFTLKDYVDYYNRGKKFLREQDIWYVTRTIIETFIVLNQNRMEFNFFLDRIFINNEGRLFIYPNLYKGTDKKFQNFCYAICNDSNDKQQTERTQIGFKTQLLKILVRMMFIQTNYQDIIEDFQKYSEKRLNNLITLIEKCAYSKLLKTFILTINNEFVVNWSKIKQQYFQKNDLKVASHLSSMRIFKDWKILEVQFEKKNHQEFIFPAEGIQSMIHKLNTQTSIQSRKTKKENNKKFLNQKLKNKSSKQQSEGVAHDISYDQNLESSVSIFNSRKMLQKKIKFSLNHLLRNNHPRK